MDWRKYYLTSFSRDRWNGLQGSVKFEGIKNITTIPDNKMFPLAKQNFMKMCEPLSIPFSQLAAYITNVKYFADLEKLKNVSFISIQANGKKDGIEYALLDDKKFGPGDEQKLMDAIFERSSFKGIDGRVLVGAGMFKYILPTLKEFPSSKFPDKPPYSEPYNCSFDFLYYKISNFEFWSMRHVLCLDMAFICNLWDRFKSMQHQADDLGYPHDKFKTDKIRDVEESVRHYYDLTKFLWEKLPVCDIYNFIVRMTNVDVNILQTTLRNKLKQLIMINTYLENELLPIEEPPHHDIKKGAGALVTYDKGFYKNMVAWDLSSAYPTTHILLDLGLYKGDNQLALTQEKFLNELKEKPHLKPFLKQLANELNGFLRTPDNIMRCEETYDKTVLSVREAMLSLAKKLTAKHGERPVRIHTDGLIISKDISAQEVGVKGYKMVEKDEYEWIYVYHGNKTIGLTTDYKIKRRGFPKGYNEKLTRFTLNLIDEKLKRAHNSEKGVLKVLDMDPKKMIKFALSHMKRLGPDNFVLFVKKKGAEFHDERMFDVLDDLEEGKNVGYWSREGFIHRFNKDKINYKKYGDDLLYIAGAHNTEVVDE